PAVADVLAKAGHPLSHPLSSRWSSVVKQWKTPPISFLFMPLRDSFLRSDGGYTYTPSPSLESILLPLCARRDVDSAPRGQQLIGENSEKVRRKIAWTSSTSIALSAWGGPSPGETS